MTLLILPTLLTLLTLDTLDNVKNVHNVQMAHPNVEDANVAPLNRPDDDFPDKNTIIIMSKNTGVVCFGTKIHRNGN